MKRGIRLIISKHKMQKGYSKLKILYFANFRIRQYVAIEIFCSFFFFENLSLFVTKVA